MEGSSLSHKLLESIEYVRFKHECATKVKSRVMP